MRNKTYLGWHLISDRRKLSHAGGSAKEAPGIEIYGGYLHMCYNGLHASRKLEHALRYHKGPYLRRVRCGDGTTRKYLLDEADCWLLKKTKEQLTAQKGENIEWPY